MIRTRLDDLLRLAVVVIGIITIWVMTDGTSEWVFPVVLLVVGTPILMMWVLMRHRSRSN